jgi:tRNA1(Val) A37 N6-methylase TrmN6
MSRHEAPAACADRTQDAFLGGKLMLLQPKSGYRAGLDAVLLAATVPVGGNAIVADLGAGVGTVGLSAVTRVAGLRAVLVEREAVLAAYAGDNIAHNELDSRAEVVIADIEAQPAAVLDALGLTADRFDHVVANPPFHVEGDGRAPPDRLKAMSHVMPDGGVERWVRSMARLTKPGGTAAMIHRADALSEVLAAFGGRFGAVTVLPVYPRAGEHAVRVIVAGRKGSRAPSRLLSGLVVHADQGHGFTPMLEAVLRHGAGLDLWVAGAPLLVAGGGAT